MGKKVPEYEQPWSKTWYRIRQRCTDSRHSGFKFYGAKGIEFRISRDEVKELWFRDKASEMERPTIDRINPKGHYEPSNCRFIELARNMGRINGEKTHCKRGHELLGDNLYKSIRGGRVCRACMRLSRNKYFKRVKGQNFRAWLDRRNETARARYAKRKAALQGKPEKGQ